MQRASSFARTLSLPLHLSVNQASSNAASRVASVLGSNDPLPSPRMVPLRNRILLESIRPGSSPTMWPTLCRLASDASTAGSLGPSTARQHPQCPPPRKPCSVSLLLVVFESSELMLISDILILTGGAV